MGRSVNLSSRQNSWDYSHFCIQKDSILNGLNSATSNDSRLAHWDVEMLLLTWAWNYTAFLLTVRFTVLFHWLNLACNLVEMANGIWHLRNSCPSLWISIQRTWHKFHGWIILTFLLEQCFAIIVYSFYNRLEGSIKRDIMEVGS